MNQNNLNVDQSQPKNVPFQFDDFSDDFNIDENSFKPVTKGLGFHQESARKQFTPAQIKATKLSTQPSSMSSTLPTAKLPKTANFELGKSVARNVEEKSSLTLSGASASKGALAAFYGEAEVKIEEKMEMKESKKDMVKNRVEANAVNQFLAFIVDILLVLSFTVATIAALVAVSRIDVQILFKVISIQDQIIFGSSLFIIYYLLYFTILDLNASPGKSLMKMRLYTASGKNVAVKHTFSRALITLLSLPALMLPTVLDFQGRLSGTKVFKD